MRRAGVRWVGGGEKKANELEGWSTLARLRPYAVDSLIVLKLIPQLQTFDLNLPLAFVLENPGVGRAVDWRLGDLIQVVLVPLVPGC